MTARRIGLRSSRYNFCVPLGDDDSVDVTLAYSRDPMAKSSNGALILKTGYAAFVA